MCSKQQLSVIYDLGQSCQVVEYALAQGMVKLQQNIDKATPTDDKEFQLMYVHQQLCFFKQVM
jgi:transcription factor TGA